MFYEAELATRKKNFYKNFWVNNSKCDVVLRNSRIPNLLQALGVGSLGFFQK